MDEVALIHTLDIEAYEAAMAAAVASLEGNNLCTKMRLFELAQDEEGVVAEAARKLLDTKWPLT